MQLAFDVAMAFFFGVPGLMALLISTYLLIVTGASLAYRPPRRPLFASKRVDILIPAHDELAVIGRCIGSLLNQSYPRCLYRIVVIADNCSDATADLARALDVIVMERSDPIHRGKGHALRWAIDRIQAEVDPPDAYVIVDADSIADRDLLLHLVGELNAGHEVVQAEYLALPATGPRAQLAADAFLLFHRVRFAGRAVLGMPANLVGNGMLLSRRTVESHPWDAFTAVEDLEYSIRLRLAGIRPVFIGSARVFGPVATHGAQARIQRRRWEGGRFYVMRNQLPALLRAALRPGGDLRLIDEAIDLAVPPLGLLVLGVVGGAALSLPLAAAGRLVWPVALLWLIAVVTMPVHVVVGLWGAGARASAFLALVQAPLFLLRKVAVYAGLVRSFDVSRWEPTRRPAAGGGDSHRFTLAGVPIDPIDGGEALERIGSTLGTKQRMQVCTVNLDFLVNAQRDPGTRAVLNRADLNVADGFPVVWLGRLLGHRVPERVAGADLVPALLEAAAAKGAPVFFLGGEDGVAARAASRVRRRYPTLVVAGTAEPPRARLDEMDHGGLVHRINESHADLLLVALGHPKQDQWIAHNREALDVSVAMGVGCALDLLAGRVTRAPRWMQRIGLEWFYRLIREPSRLLGRYSADAGWLVRVVPTLLWQRLRA